MNRSFGCIPSPLDERDYVYDKIVNIPQSNKLPKKVDSRPKLPPVRNQGKRGTCIAFAASTVKEFQERMDCNYDDYFSPEFIYYFRENKPIVGMWPRDAMKILSKRGICIEDVFPYDNDKDPKAIPYDAKGLATDYKIGKYYRIKTVDALKKQLYDHGTAIITFNTYNNKKDMWRKGKNDRLLGSHAMTVVGYNEKGFILRNSWGKKWNGNGHTIFKYKDWKHAIEVWGCEDIKGSIIPDIKKKEKKDKDKKNTMQKILSKLLDMLKLPTKIPFEKVIEMFKKIPFNKLKCC